MLISFQDAFWTELGPSWPPKVPKMTPNWRPKTAPNRPKIDVVLVLPPGLDGPQTRCHGYLGLCRFLVRFLCIFCCLSGEAILSTLKCFTVRFPVYLFRASGEAILGTPNHVTERFPM